MPPLRSAAQTNLRPLQFDQIAAAAGAADPGSQPLQLVATARRSCAQAAVRSRAMYRRTRSGSPLCSRSDFRVDVPPALDWLTSSAASTCNPVATPYRKSGAGPKPSALTLSQFLSTTSAAGLPHHSSVAQVPPRPPPDPQAPYRLPSHDRKSTLISA